MDVLYSIKEWYDGPRAGAADYDGASYWYRSVYLDTDEWDPDENRFELTPLSSEAMNIPELETGRLKLRAFTLDDLDPYAAMYADPSFVRYLDGNVLSRDEAWENIAITLGHWALLGYGIWALESKATGQLIGRAGLLNLPGWPDVEVCWALAPRFWGNGYATEAARASVDWAFQELGLRRVISLIHVENRASQAVALRLGEKFREQITFEGKPANVYEILSPRSA